MKTKQDKKDRIPRLKGPVGLGTRELVEFQSAGCQMDVDALRLAGIVGNSEDCQSTTKSTPTGKPIVKPSWLSSYRSADPPTIDIEEEEPVDSPTATPENSQDTGKKLRKRKNSTSTPKPASKETKVQKRSEKMVEEGNRAITLNDLLELKRGFDDKIDGLKSSLEKKSEEMKTAVNNLAVQTGNNESEIKALKSAVTGVKSTISEDKAVIEAEIKSLREEIRLVKESPVVGALDELKTQARIETDKVRAVAAAANSRHGGTRARCLDDSDDYWRARRGIRMWPIPGKSEQELWSGAAAFVHDKLKVSKDDLGDQDVVEVRRVATAKRNARPSRRANPAPLVREEVLVTFSSIKVRDLVMSHSFNLADYVDKDRKPLAGVRLEVPTSLEGVFRDLKAYARKLTIDNGQSVKHSIRFDDREKSFFMNVKLPDEDEWIYVDRSIAEEHREEEKRKSIAISRNRLSSCSSRGSTKEDGEGKDVNHQGQRNTGSLPTSASLARRGRRRSGAGPSWA